MEDVQKTDPSSAFWKTILEKGQEQIMTEEEIQKNTRDLLMVE